MSEITASHVAPPPTMAAKLPTSAKAILVLLALVGVWFPTLMKLRSAWFENPDYGGLYVVLILAGISANTRRQRWRSLPIEPSAVAAWSMLGGIIAILFCIPTDAPRCALFLLFPAISAVMLGLYGHRHVLLMLPTLLYCLLIIPPPDWVWEQTTLLLRYFSLTSSLFVLHWLPIDPIYADGFSIVLPAAKHTLQVADACSGIRSLLCLTTIGLGLIMDAPCKPVAKPLLMLLIPLIACTLNTLRIVLTTVLFSVGFQDYASGDFHLALGFITGLLGLATLIVAIRLCERYAAGSRSHATTLPV